MLEEPAYEFGTGYGDVFGFTGSVVSGGICDRTVSDRLYPGVCNCNPVGISAKIVNGIAETIVERPAENGASFNDESGRHVRTKKEILDEDGTIRRGCKVIRKGEVYSRKLFGKKEPHFKSRTFVGEVKNDYMEIIKVLVK